MYTGRTDANGVKEVYTLPGSDYNEMGNPLAILSLPGEKWHSSKLVANAQQQTGGQLQGRPADLGRTGVSH